MSDCKRGGPAGQDSAWYPQWVKESKKRYPRHVDLIDAVADDVIDLVREEDDEAEAFDLILRLAEERDAKAPRWKLVVKPGLRAALKLLARGLVAWLFAHL